MPGNLARFSPVRRIEKKLYTAHVLYVFKSLVSNDHEWVISFLPYGYLLHLPTSDCIYYSMHINAYTAYDRGMTGAPKSALVRFIFPKNHNKSDGIC